MAEEEDTMSNQRFWEQYAEVQRVHAQLDPPVTYLVEPAEATPESDIAPLYVYEARAMLVRTAAMDQIRLHTAAPDEDVPGLPGVRKLRLDEGIHVPTEARRLNQAVHGKAAGPNYLMSIAPVNLCPADEPRPVVPGTPLWPYPDPGTVGTPGAAGAGVSVLIIDTGLQTDFAAGQATLAGVRTAAGDSSRVATDLTTGLIKEYAGHGTFIAGVLRSVAPGTDVTVSNALRNAGALAEDALGATILAVLDANGAWPDIISLSAGTASDGNAEPISLGPLFERLEQHPGTVLVAAAGNDGNNELFWPAAGSADHPEGVISVGALRHDGQGRGCFSNHGDWVRVYAYGEQVVNLFQSGDYAYQHESTPDCRYYTPALYPQCDCVTPAIGLGDRVSFDGLASWSGTSFATPLVAGMIAAHMTETGTSDARAAARDLLNQRATIVVDAGDQQKLLALR
jgi:hypothetical protein